MKKFFALLLICLMSISWTVAQSSSSDLFSNSRDFLYVNALVNTKTEVNQLSRIFSVDNCTYDAREGKFKVRVYLERSEYAGFVAQNIPFEIIEQEERPGMVATSLNEMANWDKYPSYEVYVQLMQQFQTNFPTLCKLDTILPATPCTTRPHMILAAHISTSLGTPSDKPAFLYSATMHGDEVVGYYMMLRLIDYILNNAATDAEVQNILQNVDLYVCPLENPDGTFYQSNSQISSTKSRRYNWNGVDLNRNYPFAPGVSGSANVQPETQAIINWVADKHFVMSANFHGGAELTNYPWDSWESADRTHADANWFQYVCQNYVDDCQAVDNTYMVGETYYQPGCGSVTEGGDWYVIDGSRQDYMNYYQHCREVTMEVHFDKVVTSSSELPSYWTNSKNALLGYIQECLYGFRGIVTDAVTGEPIEAKVFVLNHDTFNSEVYSHLPVGDYHRPIKAGTYTVEVSADCYQTETFTITTTDGASVRHDVQLQPLVATPQVADQYITEGQTATLSASSSHTINWYASENDVTPLATGLTFVTPTLLTTTSFYFEEQAIDNGTTCTSERGMATVYVTAAVHDTVYGTLTEEVCGSYEIAGQTITESGDYVFFFPYAGTNGADSILTLHLTVHPVYSLGITSNCTVGDTYFVEGISYFASEPGTYTYVRPHTTAFGCDSTITYTVNVLSGNTVYSELTLEECSPFSYEGEVLITDGDYTFFYPGAASEGRDSILIIHLTLHPSYDLFVETSLAVGEHLLIGDYDFYSLENGVFNIDKEFVSSFGCDSVVHYRITVGVVSISSVEKIEGNVYPNPATTECMVKCSSEWLGARIRVFNSLGQAVMETKMTENETKINLESIKPGIYYIQIATENREMTRKMIKL